MKNNGFTFVEMLIVITILGIIASTAMPISRLAVKRSKELELKRNLRTIRTAIDRYKLNFDKGQYKEDKQIDSTGYPISLETLVDKKLLRKIPVDPMSNGEVDNPEEYWGKKSSTDDKESTISNGRDVYDIYSRSEGEALDGSKYNEW